MITGEEVTAKLNIVSALRVLILRLPHIPTPAEIDLLKRFDTLVDRPEDATEHDVDALAAGWARWWREGRTAELAAMAARVDPALVDSYRHLATYAVAARVRATD